MYKRITNKSETSAGACPKCGQFDANEWLSSTCFVKCRTPSSTESDWSQKDRDQEQQHMDELVAVIEQRNQIISSLDQDRQRCKDLKITCCFHIHTFSLFQSLNEILVSWLGKEKKICFWKPWWRTKVRKLLFKSSHCLFFVPLCLLLSIFMLFSAFKNSLCFFLLQVTVTSLLRVTERRTERAQEVKRKVQAHQSF